MAPGMAGRLDRAAGSCRAALDKVAGGPLRGLLSRVELLAALVADYSRGRYRRIPGWAISAAVFTILYLVSPVDLIPDFIPVLGFLDDLLVVTICLRLLDRELECYARWRASGGGVER